MTYVRSIFFAAAMLSMTACGNTGSQQSAAKGADTASAAKSLMQMDMPVTDTAKHAASLAKVAIVNGEDPVCGMPLTRGFEDTTLYKGRVIGFCSKECKDDFRKKSGAYKIVKK